jgi:hypothetical protein
MSGTTKSANKSIGVGIAIVAVAVTAGLFHYGGSRSSSDSSSSEASDPCQVLAMRIDQNRDEYLAKVDAAKRLHAGLLSFDRKALALLEQRRDYIESTVFAGRDLDTGVDGCKGVRLGSLRLALTKERLSNNGLIESFQEEIEKLSGGGQ